MLTRRSGIRRRLAAVVLAASTPIAAMAQTTPDDSGWPATPNAASRGAFGVIQAATLDRDELLATWQVPSPGVRLKVTTRARLGQTLTTFITFRGCSPSASGRCRLTARFDVWDPSGKRVARPTLAIWSNRARPRDGVISLGETTLDLTFKSTDPTGRYRVKAAVTDQVAGVTLHTQQVLQVSE